MTNEQARAHLTELASNPALLLHAKAEAAKWVAQAAETVPGVRIRRLVARRRCR